MRNKKLKGIVVASTIVGVAISAVIAGIIVNAVCSLTGLDIKIDD